MSTLFDRYVSRLKNHPIIAIVVVAAMIIVGIAQFTDAVSKIVAALSLSVNSTKDLPTIPGDSGWLLVGELYPTYAKSDEGPFFNEYGWLAVDPDPKDVYVRGPFYKTENSSYPKKSVVPRRGELIRLIADRNVIIAGYKTNGLAQQLMPPWKLNVLSDADYTGVKLPKGVVVEVREVSLAANFSKQPTVVWVRVAAPPK